MKKIVAFLIIVFCFSSSFSQPTLDVFPNPFYNETTLTITLQQNDTVSLIIYDFLGVLVDSLIKEQEMSQGVNTLNYNTDTLAESVYFAFLEVGTIRVVKKLFRSGQPIGMEDNKINKPNWEIFPNPVGYNEFNISYEITRNAFVHFRLFDYSGKEILIINKGYKPVGKYIEHIDTGELAPGMYFLITNVNEQMQANKVIKL